MRTVGLKMIPNKLATHRMRKTQFFHCILDFWIKFRKAQIIDLINV